MINGVYLEGLLPGLNPQVSARPGRRPERTQASLWRVYNIYKSEGMLWDEGINTPISFLSFCPMRVFSTFLLVYSPRGNLPQSESAAQLLSERHTNSEVVCVTSVPQVVHKSTFYLSEQYPPALLYSFAFSLFLVRFNFVSGKSFMNNLC